MIDVITKTIEHNVNDVRGIYFDFTTRTFRTSEGKPVTDGMLGRWVAAGEGRAFSIGGSSLKRYGLYQSLLRGASSERPGLLERVFRTHAQLVADGAPLNRVSYSARERNDALTANFLMQFHHRAHTRAYRFQYQLFSTSCRSPSLSITSRLNCSYSDFRIARCSAFVCRLALIGLAAHSCWRTAFTIDSASV